MLQICREAQKRKKTNGFWEQLTGIGSFGEEEITSR
jgi:hypothetical protein